MRLSAQELLDFRVPETTQTVTPRDAILYALSIGYGSEPLDSAHLRYIYEDGLVAAPTLANVVASAGPWMKAAGVEWSRVVHAEQRLSVHRPIPFGVPLVSRTRMLSVVDRGGGRGMFATFARTIHAPDDDNPLATVIHTNACLGDGGCGSAGAPLPPLQAPPLRAADIVLDIPVPVQAAALYRLNGDYNPLHIDPALAAAGGFARPILHGLCTFGYAGYAIGRALGEAGLRDLGSIAARFSAPVFPGEALRFLIWCDDGAVSFRALVPAREIIVLDYGNATLT